MNIEQNRRKQAIRNLSVLQGQVSNGSGIIAGVCPHGDALVQILWTMGDSTDRRRAFVVDENCVGVAITPSRSGDQGTAVYTVMREVQQGCRVAVASTGNQADMVSFAYETGRELWLTMRKIENENDEFSTPAIVAVAYWAPVLYPMIRFAVCHRTDGGPHCDRDLLERHPDVGYGYGMTTITRRRLKHVCIEESGAEAIAAKFWAALDPNRRLVVVVRVVPRNPGQKSSLAEINRPV